jgi:hypothetical protein
MKADQQRDEHAPRNPSWTRGAVLTVLLVIVFVLMTWT